MLMNHIQESSDVFRILGLGVMASCGPARNGLCLSVEIVPACKELIDCMQGNHTLSISLAVPRAEMGRNRGVSCLCHACI